MYAVLGLELVGTGKLKVTFSVGIVDMGVVPRFVTTSARVFLLGRQVNFPVAFDIGEA